MEPPSHLREGWGVMGDGDPFTSEEALELARGEAMMAARCDRDLAEGSDEVLERAAHLHRRKAASWRRYAELVALALLLALPLSAQIQSPRNLKPYMYDVDALLLVTSGKAPVVAAPQQSSPAALQVRSLAVQLPPSRFHPSRPPSAPLTVRSGFTGHQGDGNGQAVKVTIAPTAAISSSDEIVNGRIPVRVWIVRGGAWCLVILSVSVSTSPQVFTVATKLGDQINIEQRAWFSATSSAWLPDESVGAARFVLAPVVWRGGMSCQ